MSKAWAKQNGEKPSVTSEAMRLHCSRPGRTDEKGNIVYFTEQAHKAKCDVKTILTKYARTGLIDHVSKFEGTYGDMSGIDYKAALDKITGAQRSFESLPSNIRKRFKNDPEQFLRFFENPENREEAVKLGLIDARWTPDTDGLGEHVKPGDNIIKED